MDQEQWKDVVGYEQRYEVSEQGRIRNKMTGRVLKPARTSRGYLTVQLYDGSRPKNAHTFCVHDLVMRAFVGPKPKDYQVDHGLKGKQCNALDNLEYVTGAENVRRFYERGGKLKRYYGADHANAKLTAGQVRELRRLAATGKLQTTRLARKRGVSCTTIKNAAAGRTYKNVGNYSLAV